MSKSRTGFQPSQAADAGESIGGATAVAQTLPADVAHRLLDSAHIAFDSGIAPTATIAGLLTLVAAGVVALTFRGGQRQAQASAARSASAPTPPMAPTVRTWFHFVHGHQVRPPLAQRVGGRQTRRVDGVEVIVQRHVERHRDDERQHAEHGARQQVAASGLRPSAARQPLPTTAAKQRRPQKKIRNGALACASALIPRIAVMASTGSVRSRPFMTKVEKA